MDDIEAANFFGVYILYSMNSKYKGRIYIGYTVNPNKRLEEHNTGVNKGGAWKTSNRGPWNMILIVHGFPNKTAALRFEWAWQHPDKSRRLRHLSKKTSKENSFEFRLRVLSNMLDNGPWCRLPLTVHWLDQRFYNDYAHTISPPMHMPVFTGEIVFNKTSMKKKSDSKEFPSKQDLHDCSMLVCTLCDSSIMKEDAITCINSGCLLVTHIICLAKQFTKDDMLLPIEGTCPGCNTSVLWGDLIKRNFGYSRGHKDKDKKKNEDIVNDKNTIMNISTSDSNNDDVYIDIDHDGNNSDDCDNTDSDDDSNDYNDDDENAEAGDVIIL